MNNDQYKNRKNVTQHILPTSANLLGFCFIVLSSIKILKLNNVSLVDELTSAALILFLVSCIFSYLAMRTAKEKFSSKYERVADVVFISGLIFLAAITVMITFNVIT